jgi:hypothetical protein
MSRFGAACIGLLLAACSSAATSSAPAASAPAPTEPAAPMSGTPEAATGLDLQPLDEGTPAERPEAGIGFAFDDSSAVAMIDPPPQIDYSERAVVCVYLGRRTGRWTLDLQSASLEGRTLQIEARERAPRQPTSDVTLPAACGTLRRAALPTGPLTVSAHDTVSDEFITKGDVVVPAVASGS